jgi:hypothetical protein
MSSAGNKAVRNKFVTETLNAMVHSNHSASHNDENCPTCNASEAARSSAGSEADRRSLGRTNLHVRVVGEVGKGRFETDLLDLTSSGAFLESVLHIPEGTPITLKFKIDSTTIIVPAEVRYSIEHVGFGVRFVDLREEDRKRIDGFVGRTRRTR